MTKMSNYILSGSRTHIGLMHFLMKSPGEIIDHLDRNGHFALTDNKLQRSRATLSHVVLSESEAEVLQQRVQEVRTVGYSSRGNAAHGCADHPRRLYIVTARMENNKKYRPPAHAKAEVRFGLIGFEGYAEFCPRSANMILRAVMDPHHPQRAEVVSSVEPRQPAGQDDLSILFSCRARYDPQSPYSYAMCGIERSGHVYPAFLVEVKRLINSERKHPVGLIMTKSDCVQAFGYDRAWQAERAALPQKIALGRNERFMLIPADLWRCFGIERELRATLNRNPEIIHLAHKFADLQTANNMRTERAARMRARPLPESMPA